MKTFKTFSEEKFDENFFTSDLELSKDDLENLDVDSEVEELNELSLLTISIATFVSKTKQFANKIDTTVTTLKSNSEKLENPDLTRTFNSIAELFFLQRKMIMYSTLTSASAILKIDRNYKTLKQLQKLNRKRK